MFHLLYHVQLGQLIWDSGRSPAFLGYWFEESNQIRGGRRQPCHKPCESFGRTSDTSTISTTSTSIKVIDILIAEQRALYLCICCLLWNYCSSRCIIRALMQNYSSVHNQITAIPVVLLRHSRSCSGRSTKIAKLRWSWCSIQIKRYQKQLRIVLDLLKDLKPTKNKCSAIIADQFDLEFVLV